MKLNKNVRTLDRIIRLVITALISIYFYFVSRWQSFRIDRDCPGYSSYPFCCNRDHRLLSLLFNIWNFNQDISLLLLFLFPFYRIYMALTEGIGKAFISNLVPQEKTGTAFAIY